jgi:hypothetical protein
MRRLIQLSGRISLVMVYARYSIGWVHSELKLGLDGFSIAITLAIALTITATVAYWAFRDL